MRILILLVLFIGSVVGLLWLILPLLPPSPLTPERIASWRGADAPRLPSVVPAVPGTATPTITPALPSTLASTRTSAPASETAIRLYPSKERIVVAYRGQPRPVLPPPAPAGQAFVANGDVDNSQTCHIKVFPAGVPVQGLGDGSYELWVITGGAADMDVLIADIQQLTMGAANGPCPRLPR